MVLMVQPEPREFGGSRISGTILTIHRGIDGDLMRFAGRQPVLHGIPGRAPVPIGDTRWLIGS